MRRSTAAAVGTLTGAALILGVRLSVQPPDAPVATAPVSQEAPADGDGGGEQEAAAEPEATASKKPAKKKESDDSSSAEKPAEEEKKEEEAGLKAGTYKGKAVQNEYGTVQVTIKVSGGKISAADATYPTSGFSGTINPNAVKKLSEATLAAQSAQVDAVSGATATSGSYVDSLQAALDKAGA
ncbi:FMN-binding protein [Actinoplanes sp. DH11]|uniref:FMN-binding protein n=1 Tax=Actinoplanes sp. DH11 TaxID=2857011 RepID=UPI001E3A676C|nr:FMN-binding protein [Actinoplanes sp. DH11]